MLKTLKNKIVIMLAAITISVPVFLIPLQASAACTTNVGSQISAGLSATGSAAGGCANNASITTGVKNIAVKVVDLFSIVVGIVSVIMIIYAGFRYVTSGGESGSVSNAKNTLIYAIIGLIIVVLAQLIVHLVLNAASSATPGTTTGL